MILCAIIDKEDLAHTELLACEHIGDLVAKLREWLWWAPASVRANEAKDMPALRAVLAGLGYVLVVKHAHAVLS